MAPFLKGGGSKLPVNLRGFPVKFSGWRHIMTPRRLSLLYSWTLFKADPQLNLVGLPLCLRQRLESASDQDLQLYLLQLVQVP